MIWALRLELQTFDACWGSVRSGEGLTACGLSGVPHALLLGFGFLVSLTFFLLFSYLLLLHTYLLATNQTTYEVIKGKRLAYLNPYFEGRYSRKYFLPNDSLILWWNEIRGRGPPKPFSKGIFKNVWEQISVPWPREYVTGSS
jgi:hypothetical protein